MARVSPLRRERIRVVRRLTLQGLSSRAIGKRLGIAPSTVRDYRTDPYRRRVRARQSGLGVTGVHMPAGGVPIESVKSRWSRGAPHRGRGAEHAAIRGVQMRSIIGYYHRGR